jgi:hypothetical protein
VVLQEALNLFALFLGELLWDQILVAAVKGVDDSGQQHERGQRPTGDFRDHVAILRQASFSLS